MRSPDLSYLLRVPIDSANFNEAVRAAMLKGTVEYVAMLKMLQGADPMVRQTREHVRYEAREWECVGKISVLFSALTTTLQRWCSRDKRLLTDVYSHTMRELIATVGSRLKWAEKTCKSSTGPVAYEIPEKNVLTERVSTNVPLHRFISGLIPLFSTAFADCKLDIMRFLA